MKTRVLFLDDDAQRHAHFMRWVKESRLPWDVLHMFNGATMEEILGFQEFDLFFLDHDLGDRSPDGRHVAEFLAFACPAPAARVIIHSWNPLGAEAMSETLRSAGFDVRRRPFGPDILEEWRGGE